MAHRRVSQNGGRVGLDLDLHSVLAASDTYDDAAMKLSILYFLLIIPTLYVLLTSAAPNEDGVADCGAGRFVASSEVLPSLFQQHMSIS